ncbi:hypothetical protein JCM19296_1996 [Nonlabens ulvanivorans]|uniref:Uncharacterized protein n=1 Tax=Nonlabens ulvanivorans TaxID=906888 RepID=A0A081DBV3_NONUL|nr:hypothetical protein JCM19296_1996 [Nonlabens ulvanivorans]
MHAYHKDASGFPIASSSFFNKLFFVSIELYHFHNLQTFY